MNQSTIPIQLAFVLSLSCLGTSAAAQAQPDYDLELLAQTGPGLASILDVAIDDEGAVAFRGTAAGETRLFVVRSPGGAVPITPPGTGSYEGLAMTRATPSSIVTRVRPAGSSTIRVERWPSMVGGTPVVLGASPADFESANPFFDVADDATVAFWVRVAGQDHLLVGQSAPFTAASQLAPGAAALIPPSLSENGVVAFKDGSGQILKKEPGSAPASIVVGTGSGFTLPLGLPQVTSDGRFVLFTGNRGHGVGLILADTRVPTPSYVHLLGEGLDPLDAAVGIQLREVVDTGSTPDRRHLRVAFTGQAGNGPRLFTAQFCLRDEGGLRSTVSGGVPRAVLGPGTAVGGSTVAALGGQARSNRHGILACTVLLPGGLQGIVRATPRGPTNSETGALLPIRQVKVSFKRLVLPGQPPPSAWKNEALQHVVKSANTILRETWMTGIELSIDEIRQVEDPALILGGFSWLNPDVARIDEMENLAEGKPSLSGWRQDAVNIYLVESIQGSQQHTICGVASLPAGASCASQSHEIVVMAPTRCSSTALGDGIALTLAHELGHYFGLLHTFERVCPSADFASPCAFPYDAVLGALFGDEIADTPFDPYDLASTQSVNLANYSAQYGTCSPWVSMAVLRNVMSYYPNGIGYATLTAAQTWKLRDTALTQRAHVLRP